MSPSGPSGRSSRDGRPSSGRGGSRSGGRSGGRSSGSGSGRRDERGGSRGSGSGSGRRDERGGSRGSGSGSGRRDERGGSRGSGGSGRRFGADDRPRGRGGNSNDRRGGRDERRSREDDEFDPAIDGRKDWGSVARKGSRQVLDGSGPAFNRERAEPSAPRRERDEWVDRGRVGGPKPTKGRPTRRSVEVERVPIELSHVDGLSVGQLRSLSNQVGEAAGHFQNERFDEARQILARVSERYSTIPEVRELHALSLYRLGRWKQAIAQLEALIATNHTFDLHAVLADCHRALGNYDTVEELWDELREASPTGDVVTEGRIVAAGALADKGELRSAIRLLEKGPTKPKRPQESTLRLWYALADLHERVGEVPLARDGFQRIVAHDPRFGDAAERLSDLR